MVLTLELRNELVESLLDAFRTNDALKQLLIYRLGKNLDEITLAGGLRQKVFDLVQHFEEKDEVEELVAAALEDRPKKERLRRLAGCFGQAAAIPREVLQRIVLPGGAFLKPGELRRKLAQIESRVCRVEIPKDGGRSTGTGFLVGPDLVLTNHHVIAPLLEGGGAREVVLRFDYGFGPGGVSVTGGKEARLSADWLVDSSPPSEVDRVPDAGGRLPAPDELDHALLRLSSPAGREPGPTGEERGWIDIGAAPAPLAADAPLFIVQHPRGEPVQVALETRAVLGENGNRTRLRYRTSTLPGSSGSPCFDAEWRFAALHHGGDPDFSFGHRPTYNQGIPAAALSALFAARKIRLG